MKLNKIKRIKKLNKKKRFKYTFKFSNNDTNKFILLLKKGVYPYEYKNDWGKFNDTTLTEKGKFYSNLNMEMQMQITFMQIEFVKALK